MDHVIIINHGRLVVEAPLGNELTERSGGASGSKPQDPTPGGGATRCWCYGHQTRERSRPLLRGITADRIGKIALEAHVESNQLVTESSLEDIFLQLTEGPSHDRADLLGTAQGTHHSRP